MRERDGFPLDEELSECRRIIQEDAVLLRRDVTGEHYKISELIHTPEAYLFLPTLQTGPNREACGRALLAVMERDGMDPQREIDALVATSTPAMQIACTLQHFRALRDTRVMSVERNTNGEMILGRGFSFRRNERVLVVHFSGSSFHGLQSAIDAIHRSGEKPDAQPCIVGVAVLIDRSPATSDWQKRFALLKRIIVMRIPLIAYHVFDGQCSLCREAVPLVDLSGAI